MNERRKGRAAWWGIAWLLVGTMLLALAGPAPVGANGGGGGAFLVSDETWQDQPAIAYNAGGDQFLVVWVQAVAGGAAVYGQIFSATGQAQGEILAIPAVGNPWYPAAAYNPVTDQYLVVWAEGQGGEEDIYGQLVNADGTLPGAANLAISTAAGRQFEPAIAYNAASDEYLVVWFDSRNGDFDIYGQRVDADGVLLGAGDPTVNFAISTAVFSQQRPVVAYNAAGDEYLVVWEDARDGYPCDLYGQRVDADGVLLGAGDPTVNFAISTAPDYEDQPAVAYNPASDEYLVVWDDDRNDERDVYGQRLDAEGALLDNPGTPEDESVPGVNFAISVAYSYQSNPAVAYDAAHSQYLVVWVDARDVLVSWYDIYGQRVGSDGALAEQGAFAISTVVGEQSYPAVAYSAASQQYLVVWQDRRSGDSYRIYGQRVWWPGLLLGHELAVGDAVHQGTPAVAYDTREHRYLAVWASDHDGNMDIYGQLYHREGYPLDDPFPIYRGPGGQILPAVAYRPGDRTYLVVWEDSETDAITGRFVTTQGTVPNSAFDVYRGAEVPGSPAVACNAQTASTCLVLFECDDGGNVNICGQAVGAAVANPGNVALRFGDATAQGAPAVAFHPTANEYLAVWHDPRSGTYDIYGHRVDADSITPLGSPLVVANAVRGQQFPTVAANPDTSEYLVTWQDFRNGSDYDLYTQRVESGTGNLPGGNVAVAVSAPAANQAAPALVYVDTLDRFRVVWQDDRDAATLGWDLRAQWLAGDGSNLGTLDIPLVRYPRDQIAPALTYSYGSTYNKALAVWEDYCGGDSDIYGSFGLLDDHPPLARFTRRPLIGRVGDTYLFNAWPSRDDSTPRGNLQVRWDLDDDGTWDVDLGSQKLVTQTITTAGVHTVTLEVWDSALLTDTISLRVVALPVGQEKGAPDAPQAEPPIAALTVSPTWAVAGTTFAFDGSGSSGAGALDARWDWDDDGLLDTDWAADLAPTHVYTEAGDYTIRLVVRDDTGLTGAALRNITIVPAAPVQLELSPQVVTVVPGEVLRFYVTGWDQYDNVMYHLDVAWSVTNPQVGVIDASGVFTASLAAGDYADAVRVEANGVAVYASVTVAWPYQVYLPLVQRKP
jgi:PKD repeat protein